MLLFRLVYFAYCLVSLFCMLSVAGHSTLMIRREMSSTAFSGFLLCLLGTSGDTRLWCLGGRPTQSHLEGKSETVKQVVSSFILIVILYMIMFLFCSYLTYHGYKIVASIQVGTNFSVSSTPTLEAK